MITPTPRGEFLTKLSSSGKLDYKRYTQSPLRYAGGKSLAVGYVIENIPDEISKIVSPFFGGGSVEIACAKELGLNVVGYDVFDILTTYWDVQINSPEKLASRIDEWLPTKETYNEVKANLKQHWLGEKSISDQLELAAHYWFNHNLSYGPGFLGWMSKIYEEQNRYERMLAKVRNFKCNEISVEHLSFTESIAKHQDDFLYCDPPYYLGGDSKMFKGIYPQRNFPVHHNGFEHEKLRDLLQSHRGGFILSYNDCDTIREWYKEFNIKEVKWQYTLGQGETRIGKNRIENGTESNVKKSHELLIIGRSDKDKQQPTTYTDSLGFEISTPRADHYYDSDGRKLSIPRRENIIRTREWDIAWHKKTGGGGTPFGRPCQFCGKPLKSGIYCRCNIHEFA